MSTRNILIIGILVPILVGLILFFVQRYYTRKDEQEKAAAARETGYKIGYPLSKLLRL